MAPGPLRKKAVPDSKSKNKNSDVVTHVHSFSIADLLPDPHSDQCHDVDAPIDSFIDCVSDDRRRRYRDQVLIDPPSPVKRQRLANAQARKYATSAGTEAFSLPLNMPLEGLYQMEMDADDEADTPAPAPKPKKAPPVVKPVDKALAHWRSRRDEYIRAILRRAGTLDANVNLCMDCKDPSRRTLICCRECHGDEMVCDVCCVERHRNNPLHWVEKWNGTFFDKISLQNLGLRVQVGHRHGQRCPEAHAAHTDFVVLHTNGIHQVSVDFCDCERVDDAGPPEIQLLQAGWFPSTDIKPRTCTTLAVLDQFHILTLQAKTTAYDFYAVLEKLTDHTGVKPPDRYQPFLRMAREYRHMQQMKRGRRGHASSGVEGTSPGELAVLCPCCPRPQENIPDDWENASDEDKFLYIFFLALDACFCLKRRLISSTSELKDPALGTGSAYMLESGPYRQWLLKATDQKEMSTCSGLAALDFANTKFSQGYAATGIGMGVCARHEFVQANGVGDLQKGERYVNMDYIFASIMRHVDPHLLKMISYDIVCQWWKGLKGRLKNLPALVRLRVVMDLLRFVIPKMHIHSHTLACQLLFSLNLIPGSTQTDGEGIEHPWAMIGGVATSTREMGPGSRADTLDDHWGHWNWSKLLGIVKLSRIQPSKRPP
ncbi:hypothetical protein C8J57DRAFT_1521243 [Mycena rebaudengoi]|nr:hypothetical protein C8J57DRAFT_1521243 [Mycena rebaudengoi]